MLAECITVAGKFKLLESVGEGAFGEIFSGTLLHTILSYKDGRRIRSGRKNGKDVTSHYC